MLVVLAWIASATRYQFVASEHPYVFDRWTGKVIHRFDPSTATLEK